MHGAVAAVNQVLPEMLARGSGTILLTTGAASVRSPGARPEMFGNVAPAAAWLRNWDYGLHAATSSATSAARQCDGHRRGTYR